MQKLILSFSFLFILISCTSQNINYTPTGNIVIHSVNVIPMDEERVIPNQTVVIRNGRIASILPTTTTQFEYTLVIDGNGKYLMPGLTEMHAHLPPSGNMDESKEVLLLFVANGVTNIRGMLGHPNHLELRTMIKHDEKVIGPRLITSGPSFNGNSVKSAEQGAEMVRQQKAAGYDFLKIHPGISKENYAAIAQVA